MTKVLIGVEARAYNATIRNRRLALNLTQKQLADLVGVPRHVVTQLETFRNPTVNPRARLVLGVLGLDEDASPEWIRGLDLYGTRRIERSVTAELLSPAELLALTEGSFTDQLEQDPAADLISTSNVAELRSAMKNLSERERRILELRFGFEGTPWTQQEIGHELDMTRERVRQLENQALGKLRCDIPLRNAVRGQS